MHTVQHRKHGQKTDSATQETHTVQHRKHRQCNTGNTRSATQETQTVQHRKQRQCNTGQTVQHGTHTVQYRTHPGNTHTVQHWEHTQETMQHRMHTVQALAKDHFLMRDHHGVSHHTHSNQPITSHPLKSAKHPTPTQIEQVTLDTYKTMSPHTHSNRPITSNPLKSAYLDNSPLTHIKQIAILLSSSNGPNR